MASDLGVANRRGFHTQAVDDGAFNYDDKMLVECSQKSVRSYWVRPQGGVVNQRGPFIFMLEPQVDRYLQLERASLECRMQVTRRDGTKLSYFKDVVAPVNLLGAVMWETVEVELNGQRFSGASSAGAGYKAWMETHLSFDSEASHTHLNSQLMYMDSPGHFGNFQVPKGELELAIRAAVRHGELEGPDYPAELRDLDPTKNTRLCPLTRPGEDFDPSLPFDSAAAGDGRGMGALGSAAREREAEEEAVGLGEDAVADMEGRMAEDDSDDDDDGGEDDDEDVSMRSAGRPSTSRGKGKGTGKGASNRKRKHSQTADDEAEEDKCISTGAAVKRRRELLNEYVATKLPHVPRYTRSHGPHNKGFAERYAVCSGSAEFDTYSPITHDIFRMNNHLAPGNRLTVILHPHKDAFLLNTYLRDKRYKLRILDMKLHLRAIERRERIVQPVREIYFLAETQLHSQIVAAASPNVTFRMHHGGVMPKQIIVGFVTAKGFEGNYEYNPFNFHHFNCSHMELQINGEQYPSGGLQVDFTGSNALCARLYKWIFENSGAAMSGRGNLISYPHFQAGSFIIPWDLTKDQCNQLHNHQAEFGFIDFHAKFARPLHQPVYCLYELVYPRVLVNDKRDSTIAMLDVEA